MVEYLGMTPTVVIGLGGTGKEIIVKIRRMIVETYGSLEALPIVSFLHIDTEQNAKVSEAQNVLKRDISLRPSEQVWAKVDNAKAMLNQLSSYKYLANWFPAQLKGTDSILAGAGQIRALGKFAFSVNYHSIKDKFNNAKSRIYGHEEFMLNNWGVQLDKGINIFVVCSLSGGTGSGMVLDLAYNLRDWVSPAELPQTSAYLVLPGAFSGLGDRVIANAYSALKEINYYSRNDTRFECQYSGNASDAISSQSSRDVPFNFCYLVSNNNDKVTLPKLESVLEMIAQNIFLDFSSGFSQYKKLVRDNICKHWSSPDALGYPQNFIAFGLSSIQFPLQRVLQACASRLAADVVTHWHNTTPAPTAMRDLIQTEILPSLQLAESDNQHQILDGISLGDNMKLYSKEVMDWIANLRKRRNDLNIPLENLHRFIEVAQQKYEPHFNDSDSDPRRWSDYFQKMWDNLSYLKTQKRTELRKFVYGTIEDRFRGSQFVRQFLEVFLEVLNGYRSQFDRDCQKDWLNKEKMAREKLPVLLKQIEKHANQFNPLTKKQSVDADFEEIMQTLQLLYIAKLEIKSRNLGVQLLDALKEEANSLIVDLTAFEGNLKTLEKQLRDRERIYIEETKALTVNGILLYDSKDVDRIYKQILADKKDTVSAKVSQDLLAEIEVSLFDLYKFDTLRIKDLFERLLNRSVDEFIGQSQLQISTARKFLEQYPTLEQQEAQIKTTFEKSEPFLRFSVEQAQLSWENKAEKRQTLIGIQGGNKSTDAAVSTLLPMIRRSGTVTDKDIRPLNDFHHIYFVREIGAFPLRIIEGMEKMRIVYRNVAHTDKNPLHTHQNERQFSDFMPSSHEETQAKQNFLLAKAFNLVTLGENRVTGFEEIRFYYQDKQTGIEKKEVLGANWQEAEINILSDRHRQVRDLLADAVKNIGDNAATKPQKQELYQKLITCLQQLETTLTGGKDHSDYQKAQLAIDDYIKQHNLMVVAPQPWTQTVPAPQTIAKPTFDDTSNENLAKFRKLVATCYRNGNPSPTELKLIEKFTQKYQISEEIAQAIISEFTPQQIGTGAIEEYRLMYQAFLGNDGQIDGEEMAQLLELQEELGLTQEQVDQIEIEIQAEV